MALGDQSTFNKYINRDQVLSYVYVASKFICTDVIPASRCSVQTTQRHAARISNAPAEIHDGNKYGGNEIKLLAPWNFSVTFYISCYFYN